MFLLDLTSVKRDKASSMKDCIGHAKVDAGIRYLDHDNLECCAREMIAFINSFYSWVSAPGLALVSFSSEWSSHCAPSHYGIVALLGGV